VSETQGAFRARAAGLGRAGVLGAAVLLVAALVGMVNFLGWKYHARFDWTKTKLYSLSEKTTNVLAGLERDVEVVVFLQPGDALYDPTHELLARYEAASSRLRVRFMDPARNPLEAQQLAEKYDLQTASVVFAAGEDRKVIERSDLADFDFAAMQFGGEPEVKGYKGEAQFTGALVQLASSRRPKVRFTTGHGERKLDDLSPAGLAEMERLLRGDNFEIEEWASMGQAAVPAETDLLVVAGPQSTFVPPELEALSRYLDGGGRILVLLDPVIVQTGGVGLADIGLDGWLADWGVVVGRDVVVDPTNPLPFFGAETLYVLDLPEHASTRAVRGGSLAVLVSLARSVAAGTAPAGYRATELMRSSDQGWGEVDLTDPRLSDGDRRGPVPLAVAVEPEGDGGDEAADDFAPEEGEAEGGDAAGAETTPADGAGGPSGRLVVVGDSDFASDQLLQANVANGVLFSDLVNWLTERQNLLGIPPKEPERVRLSMTAQQVRWSWAFVLLILPGLAVAGGVAVYYRRRR
jgi:hypothetical protein